MKNPNPDPAKHREIAIWNAENWLYEDFEVGKRARSIRRTISEGESMLFNGMVLDMHPYVADDVFAKEEGVFKKRPVAGAMVFSLGLGLMAHNNIHTFSYGYDKLRFIKPVFVGDTIYTLRTHLEKWPKYAEMGMVRVSTRCSKFRECLCFIASTYRQSNIATPQLANSRKSRRHCSKSQTI